MYNFLEMLYNDIYLEFVSGLELFELFKMPFINGLNLANVLGIVYVGFLVVLVLIIPYKIFRLFFGYIRG